ncbi:MAG: copper transporter [Firmicutes bacterium]|nr:copper transporter [Bacillota bacterium]
MHIGFRYHIASLVAVFFSLFLGILVGSILFQDDLLIQEQDIIIGELETRFEELELLIYTMQGNLNKKNEKEQMLTMGWDQIRSVFIADRLTEHDVIFYKSNDSYNIKRLVTLVEEAGASVLGCFNWPQEYDQLKVQISKLRLNEKHEQIVIIWAEDSLIDIALQGIDYFKELGWKISLLQPFLSGVSMQNLASEALIVNNADTFLGELALIQGLSGNLSGIYGYKNNAVNLLPVLDME